MATRSIIAFAMDSAHPDKWVGRYHHSDGYPSGLGRYLFGAFKNHFQGDIRAAYKLLFEDHPAGFSCLLGCNLSLPAGYVNDRESLYEKGPDGRADWFKPIPHGAICYCHGDRHEDAAEYTHEDEPDLPYLYVFTNVGYTVELRVFEMQTLSSNAKGEDVYTWVKIAALDMAGPEPNWGTVECGEQYERCSHVADYHFPELAGTSMAGLSVGKFLGREPLDAHDAIAYEIKGKRFESRGSGSAATDSKGVPVWVAVVKPVNGATLRDVPLYLRNFRSYWGSSEHKVFKDGSFNVIVEKTVATRTCANGERKPYRGVRFVYPPTLKEPIAVFAELRKKFTADGNQQAAEELNGSALASVLAAGRLFRDEDKVTV